MSAPSTPDDDRDTSSDDHDPASSADHTPESRPAPSSSTPSPDPPDGRLSRALETTRRSLPLAVLPFLASVLAPAKVATVRSSTTDAGVTFSFPSGLPTLWSFVQANGITLSGPGGLALATWLPLAAVGLLVSAVLEAAFVGGVSNRVDGEDAALAANARRYGPRMVGVNLVRFAVVLVALPFALLGPLVLLPIIVLGYLTYGLPFVLVVEDVGVGAALSRSVSDAVASGAYARFGVAYLLGMLVPSFVLTVVVYGSGLIGVVLGAALVAVPAVFVVAYGVLVFRALASSDRAS